jgi:general secretion pathway protein N
MKRIPMRWTVVSVIVFIAFLVLTLPARHVLGWIGGGQLAVQDVDGSAWRGRVFRLALNQQAVGPLVWQFDPLMLLTGRTEYRVYVQSGNGGGELRSGVSLLGTRYVRDAQLSIPAADIAQLLRLNLVALGGNFQTDIEKLNFNAGWIDALEGRIVWQEAQIQQPSQVALGNLQMQLSLSETQILGELSDDGGPLELSGDILIGQDKSYRLNALVKARDGADPQLQQALQMLGNPDAQGRYALQLSGAL